MKVWWMLDDSFRICLHDEYDEIHHTGAIKLTEAELKDYQRVEEESSMTAGYAMTKHNTELLI